MFIPIGDEPNPPGTPWLNWALISSNILVFLACFPLSLQAADANDPALVEYLRSMAAHTHLAPHYLVQQVSAYDLFIFKYGFRPDAPSPVSLITSLFLHAGWMHLLGNMLFLWIFGDNVEFYLGRLSYALTYLLTGITATLFFAIFQLDSAVPLIGASGAISGVLGCYFVWFPNNRVKMWLVLLWYMDVIFVPARWVLGFYVLVENFLPFLLGSGGGVAYGAHIGGFLGGAGFAWGLHRWRRRHGNAWRRAAAEAGASRRDLQNFAVAMSDQRYEDALREFSVMPLSERGRVDDTDVLALADWLTERRRYEPALALLQRFVATRPHSPMLPHAHLRAGLIHFKALNRPVAASQHFLTVLDLEPPANVEAAARAALAEIDRLRIH